MLNVMRENLRSLRWVLWLVAASMVLYLGAFFSCQDAAPVADANWALRIDGDPISADRFRAEAQNIDQQYRSMFGESYEQLRPSLRIGTRAKNNLVTSELVRRDAKRIGLTVGADELAEAIRSDPQLKGADGQFVGVELYSQFLDAQYPGGVAEFERSMSDQLVRGKWSDLMTQSVTVNDAELEELHRARTEKTSIEYVVFASANQDLDTNVDETALRSWYDAHAQDYKRDPGRKIRYVAIDRDTLAATVTVGEDEIRASYEANQTNYIHPEQRRARHILFRVGPDLDAAQKAAIRAHAESTLARIKGGEDFAGLAQTLSEDPVSASRGGDLDFFGRGAMVPTFDAAAFATAVGQYAPVTESDFGFHVIQVTDAREAGTTPLDQVRDEIEAQLAARRTQEKATSEATRIHRLIGSNDAFQEVATREGLTLVERFVTRNETLTDIGVRPDFLNTVFDLEIGAISAPQDYRSGKLIVTVDEATAPEVAPFDEVRSQVQSDLLNQRMRDAAQSTAEAATRGNWSPADLAKKLKLELKTSTDLAPGAAPEASGGANAALKGALFGNLATVGAQGLIRVPAGTLAYRITGREPFDAMSFVSATPALRQEVVSSRRGALQESIMEGLLKQHEVEVNQVMIDRLDGLR